MSIKFKIEVTKEYFTEDFKNIKSTVLTNDYLMNLIIDQEKYKKYTMNVFLSMLSSNAWIDKIPED